MRLNKLALLACTPMLLAGCGNSALAKKTYKFNETLPTFYFKDIEEEYFFSDSFRYRCTKEEIVKKFIGLFTQRKDQYNGNMYLSDVEHKTEPKFNYVNPGESADIYTNVCYKVLDDNKVDFRKEVGEYLSIITYDLFSYIDPITNIKYKDYFKIEECLISGDNLEFHSQYTYEEHCNTGGIYINTVYDAKFTITCSLVK